MSTIKRGPNNTRLQSIILRDEQTSRVIFRATTDSELATGCFYLYTPEADVLPMGYLYASWTGLGYTLQGQDGRGLASINIDLAMMPRPISLSVSIIATSDAQNIPLCAGFPALGTCTGMEAFQDPTCSMGR